MSTAWPDATWHIEESSSDICDMGMSADVEASATPYGYGAGLFTCGPNAANLLACKKDAAGNALCIQNYASRQAIRFHTGASEHTDNPANRTASPIHVVLENGVTCDPMSHDQSPHYQDRGGWLGCSDNSTLFTPAGSTDNGNYFDTSKPAWTAEQGVGTNPPVTVNVKSVVFAG